MSDTAYAPKSLTRLALDSSPRAVNALAAAAGCLGLALLLSGTLFGMVFLVISLALWALVAVVTGVAWWHRRRRRAMLEVAERLIENYTVAAFGTDAAGRIQFRNPAALQRFPQAGGGFLSDAIGDLFASPKTVIARLRREADCAGAATEDIAATCGALRLSVHRAGDLGYIFRFDEAVAEFQRDVGSGIALPMMRVSKSNTVIYVNPPMQQLLGYAPKTLDRVLTDLPLREGGMQQIETAGGAIEAHLAVVEDDDGLRQVYVWPGKAPADGWTHFDAIPVPLLRISTGGEITMSNRRARALLGMQEDDDVDFADVVEGMGRPVEEWLLDVSEGRGANRTEVVRATRPSRDVFLQVALGRMVENGKVSLLAVLIDATELKTLEAQFVQSQKMPAIGQLAGGVAHDFNNLLTAISGHCDLLLLRHEPGDPDFSDLVQINQNANRAASLVGQLLAFSRKQNMQPELIDLRDTLGDLTHLLNRLVGEKIHLSWTHDPDLPRIRADKRQLEQVLMNLVVNARDAMPDGGRIKVETRKQKLAEALIRDRATVPAGDYVVVTVRDEGCGIPADKLPKIFEPFFSTKRVGEGTGLGLSMAYGIVKQSGGFIFADSMIGSGTSFTLFFPAHRSTGALAPVAPEQLRRKPMRGDGGVVLLVEDEAPVRAFASRALRLRGFTVLEAENAEQALQTLSDGKLQVDIFVTDVVMPGMDGPSWVAKALKSRPDVRVVFVSGYAEDSLSHTRSKIPNSVFLPKPFSLSQLTETVQAQLN